jgi:hypothetical protein
MNDNAKRVEAKGSETNVPQPEVLEPEELDFVGGGAFPFIR